MGYEYIFGPVNSRRLGVSLGVDLVPPKICSLNCSYCESGTTTQLTTKRAEYVRIDKVLGELHHYIQNNESPDFITLSGYGEPTLNTGMGYLIQEIKANYPTVKIAVITNGTLLNMDSVRQELQSADIVMPSLDASSILQFKKINKPHFKLNLKSHIQGLIDFSQGYKGKLWLEILFLKNHNDSTEEINQLKIILNKIIADKIQLNTLDRPGVDETLKPVSREFLENICNRWSDLPVEIISKVPTMSKTIKPVSKKSVNNHKINHQIVQLISRRSCTLEDLEMTLQLPRTQIKCFLKQLEMKNLVIQRKQDRGTFYSSLKANS